MHPSAAEWHSGRWDCPALRTVTARRSPEYVRRRNAARSRAAFQDRICAKGSFPHPGLTFPGVGTNRRRAAECLTICPARGPCQTGHLGKWPVPCEDSRMTPCNHCGTFFIPRRGGCGRGGKQRFCSRECLNIARNAIRRKPFQLKKCLGCSKRFISGMDRHSKAKFCSDGCYLQSPRKRQQHREANTRYILKPDKLEKKKLGAMQRYTAKRLEEIAASLTDPNFEKPVRRPKTAEQIKRLLAYRKQQRANPEFRKRESAESTARQMKKYHEDPEYRARKLQQNIASYHRRKKLKC